MLGYELNLCDLSSEEKEEIKGQIEVYKKMRKVLQFGDYYRTGGSVQNTSFKSFGSGFLTGRMDTSLMRACIVSEDKKDAVGFLINGMVLPNYSHTTFKMAGLKENGIYTFTQTPMKFDVRVMGDLVNTMAPIHVKQDSALHAIIAKFVKLDGEKGTYKVSGGLLNNGGISLPQSFAGTGYGENTRIYADFESRLYFVTED